MPTIVDPHIGFISFQQALRDRTIAPTLCAGHADLYVMMDVPEEGVRRLTYAIISDGSAKAYAVYIQAEDMEGKPCFGVGYATDEHYRGKGIATALVKASMAELYKGIARHLHSPGIYIEAIVGVDNLASQKVASRLLSAEPESIKDNVSGEPALHYVKFVD